MEERLLVFSAQATAMPVAWLQV